MPVSTLRPSTHYSVNQGLASFSDQCVCMSQVKLRGPIKTSHRRVYVKVGEIEGVVGGGGAAESCSTQKFLYKPPSSEMKGFEFTKGPPCSKCTCNVKKDIYA